MNLPPGTPKAVKRHTEAAFESAIEDWLITNGGYQKGDPLTFDRERCLDTSTFLSFVQTTQPAEWDYLENLLKEKAAETLINDLCRALDSSYEGCLKVLRHGFKSYGQLFRVAYFAPGSGMNPDLARQYKANILTITRQLHYSTKTEQSIDVTISVNGLPIVTAELKNPMTGQSWKNAVSQYRKDRDPTDCIFQFKRRALVHFAMDPDEVYMTTRPAGTKTRFIPFNKGRNNGPGNPDNPEGYKTAYLWEEILNRESLLDILARYVHIQIEEKKLGNKTIKSENLIFPRYHQLDCVRRMVADTTSHGAGVNYLVEHSAGSGKSNTIAWLTHRLAGLHNENDEKIFDSVIVVTDRVILDRQLQDTIYQFEHKQGVIQKIDQNSAQLGDAIKSGVPIIITTLQKFPFITEEMGELPKRRYAVVIDEAHSSQGGETATDLKGTLAAAHIREEAAKYAAEQGLPDYEEEILRTMAKRGRQPNISFYAFTATPKYKTLEVFGQPGTDGKPEPFHLYSMRQAIGEGFILDVLQNYTTYSTYFRLIKSIEDDPEVDKKKAARALARFISLHPHNISQKTEVMVEHFRNSTRHKIGGMAKAMVVTSGRLQAVRYKQAFDAYLTEHGYTDIKALVAFSGEVRDPDLPDVGYTEVGMNSGLKETELPEKFATDEYQVLLVAEKYQTGFNQPLLHTMYVDKKLGGVHAVQTLSRLNRIYPGKEDTFVLDFVNEPEDILQAFAPYYEQTLVGEQAEPQQLYELQARLDGYQVYYKENIEEFARVFFAKKTRQSKADHGKMNAALDPAVSRFEGLDTEEQEEFRKVLGAYKHLYAFLAQIIPFQDPDLEKLYTYLRFLQKKLPERDGGPGYRFDEEVAMEYYRLQKINDQITINLEGSGAVDGATAVGTGVIQREEVELSQLIDLLNERFGTEFKPADQLFLDSVREDAVADESLREAAMANTMENFGYRFRESLEDIFLGRMGQNEEIVTKFMNEKEFQSIVGKALLRQVYEQIRAGEGVS